MNISRETGKGKIFEFMTENTELIVLNFTKFQENSIILHTLSKEYGRKSFFVKLGKKANMALFLPLNIIEADIQPNPRANLWNARNFSTRFPLFGIRNNLYKNTMTLFMSEVLFKILREGGIEEGFYDWCIREILLLDAIEEDFSNFHIRFLLELAVAMGFRPTWEDMEPFAGKEADKIRTFMNSGFEDSMLVRMKGETRNKLCEHFISYLEFHTETTLHIKSLAVLRELFV